jgi:hypothetical protein
MKKQVILDELNELLNIPQLERIVFHKIEELKLYFRDEIKRYRDLKAFFKKTAYGHMEILDENNGMEKKKQMYHFELHCTMGGPWQATSIEPPPPAGFDIYDIIPEKMVEYIGSFQTAPGKIEKLAKFSLPTLKEIAFDLIFTKYSEWHILGTISRCSIPTDDQSKDEKPDHMTGIYYYHKKDTDKADYKELFYYMQKYPALRRYFFTEFHMKVKPLIVGDLIEITSSSQPVDLF